MYFIDGNNTRTICLDEKEEIQLWEEDGNFRQRVRMAARRLWVSEIHSDIDGYPLDKMPIENWTDSDWYENYDGYRESEKGTMYADRYIGCCITGHCFFLYLNGEK